MTNNYVFQAEVNFEKLFDFKTWIAWICCNFLRSVWWANTKFHDSAPLKTVNVLILLRVLSMFSRKWRNVLFAKDDGKGNFLALTYWKIESIQVSRRKEARLRKGLVQVSNCILDVWNLLTQPKRLHKWVKRFLAITSSFIIHSLKTRLHWVFA